MRVGRGGRIILDRRSAAPRSIAPKIPRSSLFGLGDEDDEKEGDDGMDVDEKEDPEEADRLRRLQERWKYDSDDAPPVGPEGPDEQDRVLVDDYSPQYVSLILLVHALH
jgi:enhancer of polycomb-like protein